MKSIRIMLMTALVCIGLASCTSSETIEGQIQPAFSVGSMLGLGAQPQDPRLTMTADDGTQLTLVFDEHTQGSYGESVGGGLTLFNTETRYRVTGKRDGERFLVSRIEKLPAE
ncbi:MAG: hypothetical protein KDI83_18300 [Gammaproteobacteria bacterium]|nr:hypothetical protein [Gammaproteobacteria bacterium]